MDDRRFDQLVRMVGQGASRRTILKGLLGLGGATVIGVRVEETVDARTARTRPTIPPPPATTTAPPTTTTLAPCPGQQQCPNSTLCCPAGACARSGNQAICCTGHVCGLECCDSAYECCDGECCAAGHTCLSSVFAEGPGVEEEVCCPAHLACDNQCCGGSCFSEYSGPIWYEEWGIVFNGHPVAIAATNCCPAGRAVCSTIDGYACCGGDTPKCCPPEVETPGACRAEGSCCTATDCAAANSGTDGECWICQDGRCLPQENGSVCGEERRCCDQVCCESQETCVSTGIDDFICATTTTTTTSTTTTGYPIICTMGTCPNTGQHSECATGLMCNQPTRCCVVPEFPVSCQTAAECPSGYLCNASQLCEPPPVVTTTTGFPVICTMGTCPNTGQHSECAYGLMCNQPTRCCVVPEFPVSCQTAAECPSGYLCNASQLCEPPP